MVKYTNFVIFTILLLIAVVLQINNKISTNFYSILPNSENKEIVESLLNSNSNKIVLLAVKGTSTESINKLKNIESEFLKIDGIKKKIFKQNDAFVKFKEKYQLYLYDLNQEKIQSLDVQKELEKLHSSIYHPFFSTPISKKDPFKLVKREISKTNIKNGRPVLNGYGYLSVYTIDSNINALQEYEEIYDHIKRIDKKYTDTKTFSTIFYFVENSRYIKKDGEFLASLAITILLFLYLFILKNPFLLLNTFLTLGSSALLATIVLSFVYPSISMFVLIFGISVSTIAVDYMFHHYFHNKYEKYQGLNKEVFLGFFTTVGVFFILSFVNFLLIKQIAIFAVTSLTFSYIVFSFIFPFMGYKLIDSQLNIRGFNILKNKYIFVASICLLFFSLPNLKFNFDIKHLDYNNITLQQTDAFFKEQLKQDDTYRVLIKSNSIEQLILNNERLKQMDQNLKSPLNNLISEQKFLTKKKELVFFNEIKQDITKHAKSIGFNKDAFENAYKYDLEIPTYSYEQILASGIEIQQYKNHYVSFADISRNKKEEVLALDFVDSMDLKTMFESHLKEELKTLTLLGLVSLFFIFSVMFFIGGRTSSAINFLMLPSAIIIFSLQFMEINILHAFMFFIILAICIDYGIYLHKNQSNQTKQAVVFSALSTFAGFGVLIFSSTEALFSIGVVALIGIISILMLMFLKSNNVS